MNQLVGGERTRDNKKGGKDREGGRRGRVNEPAGVVGANERVGISPVCGQIEIFKSEFQMSEKTLTYKSCIYKFLLSCTVLR